MREKTFGDIAIITLVTIISTFIIWIPYLFTITDFFGLNFSGGFSIIYRNFDALEYIVIAKSFYNPESIAQIPTALSPNYYAAHFPGFPLVIALFAPVLGYLKSALLVSILFTIASAIAFFFLVKDFKLTSNPLFLTLVFLFLPARWLIVRSIPTPEPMFIFFIITAFYFLLKGIRDDLFIYKYLWISAICAAFAQFTKPPGNLFALALFIFILWKSIKFKKNIFTYPLKFYPFLLIPIALISVFTIYGIQMNNFWAYFQSGDNIHLTLPPFAVFNHNQYWVGSIWLEDIIYIFTLGFLGGIFLLKQRLEPVGIYILTFLVATIFVAHRDISRYTLPVAPFVLIAFEKVLVSKTFQIVFLIIILGIYLYSQNFILLNTSPVQDLTIYN